MLLSMLEHLVDGYYSLMPRSRPSEEILKQAHVIAHRGAHKNAQGILENTDLAFRRAQELKLWGIELDVHVTADKEWVVNHDPNLKRLWGQDAAIANLRFDQLHALAPKIPLLKEVVANYGGNMHLFIELKCCVQDHTALVDILSGLEPCLDYHLLSLAPSNFKNLRHFPKESLLLVPVHHNVKELCELSLKEKYGGVLGHYLLFTNALIKKMRQAQQITGVGFINSKYSLYRELNRGIQWLFTNNAEDLSRYLQDSQS